LPLVIRRGEGRQFRRVEIIEKNVRVAGEVDVINCYIRFVLPLMVEVQHFRRGAS